jgi:hypothetical protein
MTPLTCPEVEARIELYAARECDAATGAAIERHLAGCPRCGQSLEQARQLVGLLDLHGQSARGLQRLRARIEAESRRPARRVLPALRRVGSLAALLLVTFGLAGWLGTGLDSGPGVGGGLAVNLAPAPEGVRHERAAQAMAAAASSGKNLTYPLDLGSKSPDVFRQELKADRVTRLPPPPLVNLVLQVRNDSGRDILFRLGGPGSQLKLDLRGPGVVSVPAGDATFRPLSEPQTFTLAPGRSAEVPVNRLASRSGGEVRYLYWTEPGVYTLTVRVRAAVSAATRGGRPTSGYTPVWLSSRPVTIEVTAKPKGPRLPEGKDREG